MFSGMENQVNKSGMLAAYRVSGFRARARIGNDESEPPAFVIMLDRRQKKTVCCACGKSCRSVYDKRQRRVRDLGC